MSGLVGDVTPVIHQSKTMDPDAVHHLGCTTLLHAARINQERYSIRIKK